MVPIKNIGNLPPEFQRTARSEKQSSVKRSTESSARGPTQVDKPPSGVQDQVNVSDSARTMLQRDAEVRRFSTELGNIETLAPEERLEIEAKIESGFYTSSEVTSSVAGRIAETTTPDSASTNPEKSTITPTRMQEVLEKIRTSQYDSNSVVDIIADRILKDL